MGRKPELHIICASSMQSEMQQIIICKAKGMVLLNMTHNGQNFGQGGHFISQQEIDKIRQSLGLPFTRALF